MSLIILQDVQGDISPIWETIKFVVSVLAPVLSGYIGVVYGLKQIKIQKQVNLIEKQLEQFYSPLLGIHKEIKAKSEFRFKISNLSNDAWKEEVAKMESRGEAPDISSIHREIEYNNSQLKEEFIPHFNRMLQIFKENYWLAEPETQEFYSELIEYVEVWNRYVKDGLSGNILDKLNHDEAKLKPFYNELETRTKILREKLLKIK